MLPLSLLLPLLLLPSPPQSSLVMPRLFPRRLLPVLLMRMQHLLWLETLVKLSF